MNSLYITLFFNIIDGIVQTGIKSWNNFLYHWVIDVCHLHFEPRYDFFLHLIIVLTVQCLLLGFRSVVKYACFISSHNGVQKLTSFLRVAREKSQHGTPYLALPFQTRLTQIKLALPLAKEHGSQVKNQGRQQCHHNKHKKFPYRPTCDVSLLSGHASYL
jgi:hypothetical protein